MNLLVSPTTVEDSSAKDCLTLVSGRQPCQTTRAKPAVQDRERVNVNQDHEVRDWAKSLKTTPERVKEAVRAVGDRVEKVRDWLRNK